MARRSHVKRNSHGEDWAALILVAICFAYGMELLAVALFVVLVWLGLKFLEKREAHRAWAAVNQASLSMEADHQNLLAIQGDPAGVYGRFDAYTMPTRSHTAWDWNTMETMRASAPMRLDDYNDGMDQWR